MEIWKEIPGISNYQASNLGRIKSLSRTYKTGRGYLRTSEEKIIVGKKLSNKGYKRVSIKGKVYQVHRLIAMTFIPNLENKPQINHKDGNKLNNYVENLEWVTNQENRDHAVKNNLHANRTNCNYRKLTLNECIEMKNFYENGNYSTSELGKIYNLNRRTVLKIINRIRAGKYHSTHLD